MAEQVTVNLENLREDERAKLMEIIESAAKRKTEPWKPKIDEKYYTLDSGGFVFVSTWHDNNFDLARFDIGNCFKTEEEASFHKEHLKVIAELHRFAIENNPTDFDRMNYVDKWRLHYDLQTGKISAVYNKYGVTSGDIFASSDIAKAAIEKIGKDRLKKYYFCVK